MGVWDSTVVEFVTPQVEDRTTAPLSMCKLLHGNKNRVKAFGLKSQKLALAA